MHSFPVDFPREERLNRPTPHRLRLILTDFVLINVAFFLASLLCYGLLDYTTLPGRNIYLVLFVNAMWGIFSIYFQAYRWYERVPVEQQLSKICNILVFLLASTTLFYYHYLQVAPYTPFILVAHGLALLLVSGGRIFLRLREESPFERFRYAIVGGKEENINRLLKAYDYAFPGSAQLVGRFGNDDSPMAPGLGGYEDIKSYLLGNPEIDKLVFFDSILTKSEEKVIRHICDARGITIEVAARETTLFPRNYDSHNLGDMIVLTLREEPLTATRNKIVKRIFDSVFSTLVIMFVFPVVLPIVALCIWIEDPGPIFFRQERSGFRNRGFKIWKFRTMRENDECDEKQCCKDDDRITKVGAFLRRTSIDEIPQFINVFFGDMSVVGPRPHMIKHTKQYAKIIDTFMIRHTVKPGVTGLAQISGFRGPTEAIWKMRKRVEYDVRYLENWSLWLDLRCIVITAYNAFILGEENAH